MHRHDNPQTRIYCDLIVSEDKKDSQFACTLERDVPWCACDKMGYTI